MMVHTCNSQHLGREYRKARSTKRCLVIAYPIQVWPKLHEAISNLEMICQLLVISNINPLSPTQHNTYSSKGVIYLQNRKYNQLRQVWSGIGGTCL